MESDDVRAIGRTLLQIARPDMKPRQLLEAARKAHPEASKQDIARAALYAIISRADAEPEKAKAP